MKSSLFKNHCIFLALTIAVFAIDQLTKHVVKKRFVLQESKVVIPDVFSLTYSTNTGAAFGILQQQSGIFILLSFFVIGVIIYYYDSICSKRRYLVPAALSLGGVLGNLLDRIRYEHVTDFLDFHVWPIFNIADTALTIGCIILIVILWKEDT